ncbi:Polyketide synthase [Hyphodiscus hymeniophilus]|uniref:Polyketide synthase n=1 Tax=Hyphodiscus hymeniophilus TaxID=353542 RepID=A0A9P6VED7_9HELO|nr:Polyketide synthase [Hyphodiscus hymeniophilus]
MTSAAPLPASTILITGGSGSLGSAIAIQIAKSQPGKHHLILTARKPSDETTINTSAALRSLGASFEFQALDLSSLEHVKSFAAKLTERSKKGEVPPFDGGGVALSAAMLTYVKDSRTKDGWNEVYGINVLAQVLFMRELLPVLGGAMVIVIASATHAIGSVDYFLAETIENCKGADGTSQREQETFGLSEAMKRYGSSKLLFVMASYALQRRINAKPSNTTQIINLDPGGMSGDSRMGSDASWILRFVKLLLVVFGPMVRWLKKDAFNPPEVPAKAISDLLGRGDGNLGGKYFILDDEVTSSAVSLDVKLQGEVWAKVCRDLGMGLET